LPAFATEANAQADTVNTQTALATSSAAVSSAASKAALGAANYKGLWSSLTGALSVPASVTHSNVAWLLINNVADVTLSQPGVSADWVVLNAQAFEIGDIKMSSVAQGATWLPCDGSEYTTATYPTLGAELPNTSYDLDNSSATMITTGVGTVAYNGTNTYVMVDSSGTISSSTDGVTWVERFAANTSTEGALTFVGGNFCVGGLYGFYYSADGITWAFKYLTTSFRIREVRFGAGVFVALSSANSSNIFYSATIGGTYTNVSSGSGAQNRLLFLGTRFFVLGAADATSNIYSSLDGITWASGTGSSTASINFHDMDYDGTTNYVVVGGNSQIFSSANGTSWVSGTGALSGNFRRVRFANSLWIAATIDNEIFTSTNSTAWTARTTGLTTIYGLAFGNGKWVAVSNSFSRIAHSTDGTTWTIVTGYKFLDPSTDFRFVPIIFAGGKFVYSNGTAGAVHTATDAAGVWTTGKNQKWIGLAPTSTTETWFADNGSGTLMLPANTGVLVTTNQTSYTYRPVAAGAVNNVNKIDFAGNAFFTSTTLALYRSADLGVTWTAVATGIGAGFTSVNYNGSLYLATALYDSNVGTGTVRTSSDGITWTQRTVGGSTSIVKSFWFNNAWIIYNSDTVYRSLDGITWVTVLSIGNIQSVKVVNNVMFVLSETNCFKSTDGLAFTRLTFQGTAERKYDVEYFSGKYVITAFPNTATTLQVRNTIWTSTDGTYFYPSMMPSEIDDQVWLLKIIGSTLYALGMRWIYSTKDGVNWARFPIPRVSLNSRQVALINFASKIVLHTSSASFPVSTTKFRVPEPTLQLGAPAFIKANYS
jgi:hypothetical protein